MSETNCRTYLHYYDERINDSIILSFRSIDTLNDHLVQHEVLEEHVFDITKDIPVNPQLSHIDINRILQSAGCQDTTLSEHKGGVKHRSIHI